jgi:putative polyhydroxyalkanoate system protein
MADIKMIKYHALPLAKAKQLVQKAADDLGKEYDLTSEWHGHTLRFHRSGVEGHMKVTAADIHLDVTLGFLLKPFKAKFVERIEHNFDRLLAHAAAKDEHKAAGKAPGKSVKKVAKKTTRKA